MSASLAIDHPRIPFPSGVATFDTLVGLGQVLGQAHLLEADFASDIRFVGDGANVIEDVSHDPTTSMVPVNQTQSFTGVPREAWTWGEGFWPLEQYLDERRGGRLDTDQIQAFQSTITLSANAYGRDRA